MLSLLLLFRGTWILPVYLVCISDDGYCGNQHGGYAKNTRRSRTSGSLYDRMEKVLSMKASVFTRRASGGACVRGRPIDWSIELTWRASNTIFRVILLSRLSVLLLLCVYSKVFEVSYYIMCRDCISIALTWGRAVAGSQSDVDCAEISVRLGRFPASPHRAFFLQI